MVNHAQPDHPIQTELVSLQLTSAAEPRMAYVERIDENHANPRQTWAEMGKPTYLSHHDVSQLEAVSRLVKQPVAWRYDGKSIGFDLISRPMALLH